MMNDSIFDTCAEVSELLNAGREVEARNQLIRLLDFHENNGLPYSPVVNHLLRETGLYPYLDAATASWQERYIYEAFKVDIGASQRRTLHREQSAVLKRLLDGESLAVSAPTSFGKSFIVDAYIALRKPTNVVIIVPTIALTDETRRRLHRKFARDYKIITTTDVELADKNIFVFPQERAVHYAEKLDYIDILIVDEFYKASQKFDKERSASLIRAMLRLGERAKQKYFLAPNISKLADNPFTAGMEFIRLEFNTVFLEKHDLYKEIKGDEIVKSEYLISILEEHGSKTLVYAGTYSNIDKVANLLVDRLPVRNDAILRGFETWLATHYDKNWHLTNLVKRGVGVHNGQLHRSLSQIQIRLFEEVPGLDILVSTSSIVEGINTCAENVIIWRNRNGSSKLSDFTYKNIIGRGGRMFRHFVGKIFILETPPSDEETQLDLSFPDELLGDVDEKRFAKDLTREQLAKVISYKQEVVQLLGSDGLKRLQASGELQTSDFDLVLRLAREMSHTPSLWSGLGYLNSKNPNDWDSSLYKILNLYPGAWDIEYRRFIGFIKVLSLNWTTTIPQMLELLDDLDLGVDDFFRLERNASFKLASLLNDVNIIARTILGASAADISSFVAKAAHAFLPSSVYQLEEYGLPRMIAKRIHEVGLINFEEPGLTLHQSIQKLKDIGLTGIFAFLPNLDAFDKYILEYFYEGISDVMDEKKESDAD